MFFPDASTYQNDAYSHARTPSRDSHPEEIRHWTTTPPPHQGIGIPGSCSVFPISGRCCVLATQVARINETPMVSPRFPSLWRVHPANLAANSSKPRLPRHSRAAPNRLSGKSGVMGVLCGLGRWRRSKAVRNTGKYGASDTRHDRLTIHKNSAPSTTDVVVSPSGALQYRAHLSNLASAKRQAHGRRVRDDFVVWRMLHAASCLPNCIV